MKKIAEYKLSELPNLMGSLLHFSTQFKYSSILSSNQYKDKFGKYELLAAFGAVRLIESSTTSFDQLQKAIEDSPSWLFGHLSYDLKNELEELESNHQDNFEFENLSFFEPEFLFVQKQGDLVISIYVHETANQTLLDHVFESQVKPLNEFPFLEPKMTKDEYLEAIQKLKGEIQYGNIYEINYCQEFYTQAPKFHPQRAYLKLLNQSKTPFSAFYQCDKNYLLCASPERYIAKRSQEIISQPIKGTAKRGLTELEDDEIKESLRKDLKEQTENVMIVDLVRNDLSITAKRGSVEVEELFGVYTFPQVHQLISTIKSKLELGTHFVEVLKHSFPMGSMTGAPKISAMKIAEQHEKSRRGLYSGSVGYICPNGDFDFNVVIRSLIYHESTNYLSLSVGGAITNLADSEAEYNECLLKAKAIFDNK